MSAIIFKRVDADTLTAETLGHHYTIKRGRDWEKHEQFTVTRRHISARAYRPDFPAGRRFNSLAAVEHHYKPLRGLATAFAESESQPMMHLRVEQILRDCLLQQSECESGIPGDALIVDALTYRAAFNRERIEARRADIVELCHQLPQTFFQDGGDSFLHMCWTRECTQWGEHRDCEHLVALISAAQIGRIEPADRALWNQMAGGMPHIVLTLKLETRPHAAA